jgi:predicted aconitase
VTAPPDPGLQQQRTGLAWTRSSLVVAANARLVARAGTIGEALPLVAAGVVLVLAAAGIMLHGRRRQQQIAALLTTGRTPLDLAGARALVVVAVVIAAAAVWAVLL